ncbi:AcvB/VirJ family lysyl-phosphatidylglycerol hydrolase [Sphingomonas sp. KR1UV-12]|uniref:AcvB/VirJ family lysyl-phosphatidylglycerol hydrolase n=1 Tax=Sphingomonas aurea TaxID=3063994 RepID=A0ABT9EI42_9SPHN|nr:AcvB/VirJ family lysyl-phosphatidylglycerol hydrolase [Sphingomonas sp. KR1UV-12]MDP1026640.1 AcvB/VirJ family lysyl-phosphatidylglycerol hydrolase [Sphingomonas sp. KR1UV-12]
MAGRRVRRWLTVGGAAALLLSLPACVPQLLGGRAYRVFPAPPARTVALFVSGDTGLRYGMARHVAKVLAADGLPIVGISSTTAFASTRTRADVDAVLMRGIRQALALPGAERLILIGQSFGADMLSTGTPDLPEDIRRRVVAIVLVVPGKTAFFHADPLGFAYHGTPDARPAAGVRGIDWAPVTCIQGAEEEDSLCPELVGSPVVRIVLPGGHYLHHDYQRVAATVRGRLAQFLPDRVPPQREP